MIGDLFVTSLWRLAELRRLPVIGHWLHGLARVLLPRETRCWVQVRQGVAKGLWLKINPRTGRPIYDGTVEAPVQEALRRHLRPGMVFYDVGANVGLFTLIAARRVGSSGKVYAFEADPDACRWLRENVARNIFRHVVVVEAAGYSTTGRIGFVRADPSASLDLGVGTVDVSGVGRGIDVPCVALDEFVGGALPPDVIKCDVEGAELAVLEGARLVLEGFKPVILCEVHQQVRVERVLELLESAEYEVSWLDTEHVLALPRCGAGSSIVLGPDVEG